METAYESLNGWMDKEDVTQLYNRILQFSNSAVSDILRPHGLQQARSHCPSSSPRACSNSWPLSPWCHPIILSSVFPFCSRLQSFPASGLFNESILRIRWPKYWSFSFCINHPVNIQDWPPLGWTGLVSFQSKGLSIILSNTTLQKHHFFSAQLSLWSISHIHTLLLEK